MELHYFLWNTIFFLTPLKNKKSLMKKTKVSKFQQDFRGFFIYKVRVFTQEIHSQGGSFMISFQELQMLVFLFYKTVFLRNPRFMILMKSKRFSSLISLVSNWLIILECPVKHDLYLCDSFKWVSCSVW